MSYNIDRWRTKKLENLVVPLTAFYKHERKDWHPSKPTLEDIATKEITLKCGCNQKITGILDENNQLQITKLDMNGEGSGTFFEWILEPALKESHGQLEAVLIWERGDSVTRLTVNDGVVKHANIDL